MHELKSISDMRFKVNGLVGLLNKLTVKKSLEFVNINSFLPDEVLEKIFFLLPNQDLKVVLMGTWLEAGSLEAVTAYAWVNKWKKVLS